MVKVKPLSEIKENFRSGATVAPARYRRGVERTTDWQAKASSDDAESLYRDQVSKAVAEGTRQKALSKLSNEDWKRPALDKGAARIGPGMTAAVEKQAAGYAPIRSALEALTLPPKTADPMANIDARVKPVVMAEIEAKKARLG